MVSIQGEINTNSVNLSSLIPVLKIEYTKIKIYQSLQLSPYTNWKISFAAHDHYLYHLGLIG
jgi:hypothetical protein